MLVLDNVTKSSPIAKTLDLKSVAPDSIIEIIPAKDGYAFFKTNKIKYGLLNPDGTVKIPAKYRGIGNVEGDYVVIGENRDLGMMFGVISFPEGKEIISPEFSGIEINNGKIFAQTQDMRYEYDGSGFYGKGEDSLREILEINGLKEKEYLVLEESKVNDMFKYKIF